MSTLVGPPEPEDYRYIVDLIEEGQCVPFLGAGANLCGHNPAEWNPEQRDVLPLGGQLANWLAAQFHYPAGTSEITCGCHNTKHQVPERLDDLMRISQYVVLKVDKGQLVRRLRGLLDFDYPPTALHRMLAAIPAHLRARDKCSPHLLVLTTNYDDLMERAFAEAGEPAEVIYYVPFRIENGQRIAGTFMHQKPNGEKKPLVGDGSDVPLESSSIVFKIHGTVERNLSPRLVGDDTYVISEDDYIEYLTRTDLLYPAEVMRRLRGSSFLFLGYGLRDWNLRAFLNRVWDTQAASFRSWAIQFNPDGLESGFWRNRGVNVFNEDLATVVGHLCQLMNIPLAPEGPMTAAP
jgi:hypothetical protein